MITMKKKVFLMALVGAALTACSNHDFETWSEGEIAQSKYEAAFIKRFGQPAPNHTWGFGDVTRSGMTRSAANPEALGISAPYDEAWVAEYLKTAKEPNSTNISDNYDNTTKTWVDGTPATPGTPATLSFDPNKNTIVQTLTYNFQYGDVAGNGYTSEENKAFWTEWCKPYIDGNYTKYGVSTQTEAVPVVKAKLDETNRSDWYSYTPETEGTPATDGYWVENKDEDFVLNFKITGTWDGNIGVLATEGLTDGVANGNERTVVVTGKWNMAASEQRVGGKGRIIVANGGEINIPAGCNLNSVNEAQIVVLPGGKITGDGAVAFNNGTSGNLPSYNGGTIDVAGFNNNGGDFYNYGTLKAKVMDGGAGNSHYYNHNIINIKETGSSANLRIYNNCQFYCSGSMRARNYEGVMGSSLICGGELMFSSAEDGTGEETYVGLAAGALVQCGTLYNQGTKWYGPTTGGYAVLDITDRITFINNQAGDFANNIYVCAGTWDNTLSAGNFGGKTAKEAIETVKTAAVTIIEKSNDPNDVIIPSDDFVAGVSGCTPGFNGKTPEDPDPTPSGDIRVIAEDLTVDERGDFDFNDVVFDIILKEPAGKTIIILRAAGGTLPLRVAGHEVHAEFGVATNVMVNTGSGVEKAPVTFIVDGELNADGVIVEVQKDGQWIELKADRGRVPCKIAVDCDYDWCSERQDIEKKYPMFKEYVGNPNLVWYK